MEPEATVEEANLEDQVAILMHDLPAPVQAFLRSPERDTVSLDLSRKYNLHADQAGEFSTSYLYMLLGVYTPEEFVQELRAAGIPEASIQGLAQDVNERVFKRLQSAERVSTPPAIPTAPPPRPVPPPPAIFAAPVPPPAPPMPPVPMPAPPVAPHPAVRTMAQDMQLAKEGGFPPHPQAPQPVSWMPSTQARTFQTSSVPSTGAPLMPTPPIPPPVPPMHAVPPPLPVPPVPPAPPIPPMPRPMPPAPPNLPGQVPTPPVHAPSSGVSFNPPPIVKEYSVDPYRETPQ